MVSYELLGGHRHRPGQCAVCSVQCDVLCVQCLVSICEVFYVEYCVCSIVCAVLCVKYCVSSGMAALCVQCFVYSVVGKLVCTLLYVPCDVYGVMCLV